MFSVFVLCSVVTLNAMYALQANMREAECARSNLAEDLSRLRMELEKVTSLLLVIKLDVVICVVAGCAGCFQQEHIVVMV